MFCATLRPDPMRLPHRLLIHTFRGSSVLSILAGITLLMGGRGTASAQQRPPTLDPTYGMRTHVLTRTTKAAADAAWIWAETTADNQTVYLRGAITLKGTPKRAWLSITADDFFTLYVNGRQLDQSVPDPNTNLVWKQVHRVNLAAALKPGRNVIAVQAINAAGAAGVVARLEVDGKRVLLTGPNWKVAPAGDAPDGWTGKGYDDAAWPAAHVIAPLNGDPWAGAGGLDGWPGYDSAAPYMAHLTLNPVAVPDIHPGSGQVSLETGRPQSLTVQLAPSGAEAPAVTLDFGKELAGRVRIVANGNVVLLVGTGESREEAEKSPWGGQHRLDIESGQPAYTPYSALRFARIAFPTQTGTSAQTYTLTVTLDHKYYPVTYRGTFACSDKLLTRLWYTGAYTAHLCMQEDIWDAPKRDRARWMGDLHVSGAVIDVAFADRFLMEQTMQKLRDEAQGGQPDTALPRAHVNGISGYSCAWICGLADFHRHLGDDAYLHRQHDLLVSMLEFMRADLDERGLYANRHKAWAYVDWAPDFNGDSPRAYAATHMFYIKAAREAAFLFHEMGDSVQAARSAAWADALTRAAQSYLFNPDTRTLSDRRQDNAMAIYAGMTTPEQTQAIYAAVLRPDSPAWRMIASPYYNNYVIYAMSLAGHTRDTLDILRRYWGGMLAEGATSWWEAYDPSWEKQDFHAHLQADNGTGYFVSLCHGWSAGPTSWLTERVLGVRPTGGGFKTVEIAPDPGDLVWAEGDVPTPHGNLHVRVERVATGMRVQAAVPAGVEADITPPGGTVQHVRGPARVELTGR